MKQRPTMSKHEQGLTLVELLVALAIGLVLLGGVYQVFVSSTTVYRKNEQFARLQENARFAMEILGRNLRTAGYTGCSNQAGTIVNTLNDTSFMFDFNVGLQGFDYTGPTVPSGVDALDYSPNLDAAIPLTDLVEGSDIITIRSVATGNPILLETAMPDSSADLKVTDGTSTALIDTNDIVMISDCRNTAVFQVTNYTQANGNVVHNAGGTPTPGDPDYPGNLTKNLGQAFPPGSEIVKLSTTSYLIRNNPAGVPALYRAQYGQTEELVEGIERMQLRYGVDTTSDRQVDSYVSAAGVADWNQVIAVRVGLLVQGPIDGKAAVDTNTYDLDADGAAEYDPPDERRMRRVFKSTFVLRNRAN
ncbi:MAG: prepilin-type N-terminal cleavage/methylation domain-containing protein [Deltaproteobacteria bacterium]|nr:prepilin-type N-terminal cleavage/methylation domain-containing protein [Deltaproteobacteria bacterium]